MARRPDDLSTGSSGATSVALAIGFGLGLLLTAFVAFPLRCHAQELGALPVDVMMPAPFVEQLSREYDRRTESGYCLTVRFDAGVWWIVGASRPVPRVAASDSIVFGCARGAARLHTHADSDCTVHAGGVETCTEIEDAKAPGLSDLRGLRASGAPFDVIQYGPRSFFAYRAAPLKHSRFVLRASATGGRLQLLLDSLAETQARIDTMTQGLGYAGSAVTIAQLEQPPHAVPIGMDLTAIAAVAGAVIGSIDRDPGGYRDSFRLAPDKEAHALGSLAAGRFLADRAGWRWGALSCVVLGAALELGQRRGGGRASPYDLAYDAGGCASGIAWSLLEWARR